MPPPQKASMQSTDYLSNEKRARPPGTHSIEVPLRTLPEYAPKDAPKLDTSFACISSGRNISGISIEPLLRINAKSQAVTGEPFRAGSAPMTSAATTPQPAGKSIANSAAIWRRGINVRLFECSDCSIEASGAEKVVKFSGMRRENRHLPSSRKSEGEDRSSPTAEASPPAGGLQPKPLSKWRHYGKSVLKCASGAKR